MGLPNFKYILARILTRILTRQPVAIRGSTIDKRAAVGNGAVIVNSSIGKYSYIYDSGLICTKMGAFCSIAGGCSIGGGMHPTDCVSSSPVFYKGKMF